MYRAAAGVVEGIVGRPTSLESGISPAECARRALDGDVEAFGLIYDRFAPEVQLLLSGLRIGLDHQQLEDMVQESFLRLYRRLPQLELDRSLKPYLLGIARNLAMDHLRGRSARPEPLDDEPASDAEPVDRLVARAEWSRRVGEALQALAPPKRAVLTLRHQSGLTMRHLAEVLECSQPTARARLREAARCLAIELRRRGVVPADHRQERP